MLDDRIIASQTRHHFQNITHFKCNKSYYHLSSISKRWVNKSTSLSKHTMSYLDCLQAIYIKQQSFKYMSLGSLPRYSYKIQSTLIYVTWFAPKLQHINVLTNMSLGSLPSFNIYLN